MDFEQTPEGEAAADLAVSILEKHASPERLLEALRATSLGAVPVYIMDFDELPLTGSYKVRRLLLRSRLVASGAAPTAGVAA